MFRSTISPTTARCRLVESFGHSRAAGRSLARVDPRRVASYVGRYPAEAARLTPRRWANLFLLRTSVRSSTLSSAMHHLEVRARFLADPAMWIADICDSVTGEIIWSGWTDEWSAYETVDEATARASEMLRRLTSSRVTAA